ncbi:hypothetical protein A2697_04115 [Candidatus Curtissbacteria bacterium RIFCSPHIGHO2_01_FULL_41_44]|uniref:Uncharacterized protein n=1 Tax=Candidatus Curtissbacteria bacterium RIFCSPLOWO2_01_FULL_42_50 TaxID=1797730 RepID=A0A1F5H2X5_9BACT|nr:MAG: hypothetical protein A3C33_04055 [Candidatus Curtissbacteria bacterium RIFCSPHIGHO2_02_FULL_42_58]OGD93749.1 MAG: hypothetical protein A2697_04115 [Candidatus Curtissbacteria bacterium RIFCSPHIGHO2_01_FULL_41_44]OGD97247.1 MAG: hypothetical protein A3E71_04265 [Candidatus Curtissbacteria bacterium RIFCSPHIGHO2_12_FULL_42_33]OGD98429.1 MAG: hypothetical protein A3B54_03785 [Candidatus Curtissbacteria bacterium RIFCSPLOWO2_01_FULL_42_50]OGE02346.1 MAG: hypothetical protein A3G16_03920 [Ca
MSVPTDLPIGVSSDQSDDSIKGTVSAADKVSANVPVAPPGAPKAKEQEPKASDEDKIMAEIKTTAEALDKELIGKVQESVKEIVQAKPEPEIPPDVEDVGVYGSQAAAEEVVKSGTTLDLPISGATYKRGLSAKLTGKVFDKVVVGASSLMVLAIWIGRLIKIAHKHTMRVVFRKGAN